MTNSFSDQNEFMAPGKAVWAPRLRLTKLMVEEPATGANYVEFEATDNTHAHVWAVPENAPEFKLIAVVHPDVQLKKGVEYFAYFVPVEATIPE